MWGRISSLVSYFLICALFLFLFYTDHNLASLFRFIMLSLLSTSHLLLAYYFSINLLKIVMPNLRF